MTEDGTARASEESAAAASAARQRKKRKWDQPAESLVAAGLAVPGALPLGVGGMPGIALPGVALLSGPLLTSPATASFATASQLASIPQNAASIVQKLNQPKIQDELIAREIVINDAEPTIRCKLTKRQTQEEIQRSTGAVVITRGKYHPPNGPPDTEKPLYLHISAGSHLKDTAERIKAVDQAASMVEEILKQGQNPFSVSTILDSALDNGAIAQPLSTCLFLGFDSDPSLNIAARIRGPNDQYINHIMNETGATVVLRGRGSGDIESSHAEEMQQPLHLYLTGTTSKSLDDARILAENLLDTICGECGTSRISSCKVYNAVPPPQQLLAGVASTVPGSACTAATSIPVVPLFAHGGVPVSSGPNIHPPGNAQPGGLLNYGNLQPNVVGYSFPSVSRGTSYSGYGGIYPQATPLQQVALALRQAPASTASVASTSQTNTSPKTGPSVETEKRPPQKRKFQELPVTSKEPVTLCQNSQQESEFLKPGSKDSGMMNLSCMPPPKKLIQLFADGMPPPPPRNMPPPPPKFSMPPPQEAESRRSVAKNTPLLPPKFSSPRSPPKPENGYLVMKKMPPPPPKFLTSQLPFKSETGNSMKTPSSESVSDTLLKLVEYGEEDEDDDGVSGESPGQNSTWNATSKPFWAV